MRPKPCDELLIRVTPINHSGTLPDTMGGLCVHENHFKQGKPLFNGHEKRSTRKRKSKSGNQEKKIYIFDKDRI